ncbi:hypothetical protein AYI69_g7281 [Smittium culicis]|uniref:Uncharacterized protein n=1 Tax=Smittium culicis TaxID=133412 RepID=A0A1R1XT72_9FUNG|nr:hypothetical protein AYI69_g7281 [Smittium culicis]
MAWSQSCKLNRKNPDFWIAYANFMKTYDSIDSARDVYKLALTNIFKTIKNSTQFDNEMMYLYCPKIYEEYLLTELELGTAQDYIEANSEIEGCKSKISNFLYHYYQQKNFSEDQSFVSYDAQTDKPKDVLGESTSKRSRLVNESIEENDLETLKKPKLDSNLKNDSQYSENIDKTINRSNVHKKINYTVLVYPISNRVKNNELISHFSKVKL